MPSLQPKGLLLIAKPNQYSYLKRLIPPKPKGFFITRHLWQPLYLLRWDPWTTSFRQPFWIKGTPILFQERYLFYFHLTFKMRFRHTIGVNVYDLPHNNPYLRRTPPPSPELCWTYLSSHTYDIILCKAPSSKF